MQGNKRTLFKVGCGAIAASAIAAGVIFELTSKNGGDHQFGSDGKMSQSDYEFMSYVSTYGKNYKTKGEYKMRQSNWSVSDSNINACNNKPNKTSSCGHNFLSDMTPVELKGMKGFDAHQAAAQPMNKKWFGPMGPMGPPGPNEKGLKYTPYSPYPSNNGGDSGGGGYYPYVPYPNAPVTPSGGGGSGGGGSGGGNQPYNPYTPPVTPVTPSGGGGSGGGGSTPASINWVTKGKVTPIQNQGQCGSCWSFSASGNISSRRAIHYNTEPVDFSEQQLIDCSGSFGNNGCSGGIMDSAFQYVEQSPLELTSSYPYKAVQGSCEYNSSEGKGSITSFTNVQHDSVAAFKAALDQGPVSIAVDASQTAFQSYTSGVITADCGSSLDHGIMAVGYDTDPETGVEYFLVKNQWGLNWGDQGYLKIGALSSNPCGILSLPSFVTFD